MVDIIIAVLYMLSAPIVWIQIASTIGIVFFKERMCAIIFLEFLPFFWFGWLGFAFYQIHAAVEYAQQNSMLFASVFMLIGITDIWLSYVYYKMWKKSDDDRWKKRRKKLADKVKNAGARLVVVPATS